ncbi:MAG TPA: hypothetical protein PKY84_08770, partial [Thermosynergistes sp.]|nr:hypothetical protein [Thermosynergistes sp.]
TTGAGSALMNKAKDAWKTEYNNNSSVAPDANAQDLDSGRHFGVYAIDVTDPKSPKPMWSKSNLYWKRGNSDENSPDLDVDYVVARPLIGFTEDDGTRHWHAILLGVDSQGGYRWYDFDPITGAEKGKGVFDGSESGSKSKSGSESESVDLIDGVPSELYYPSRILAAFPPNGASPALSDVYVYLSNGCLYYWNVQRGEPPKKLLKLYVQINNNNNEGLPPVGDFDIAYVRENGELHTYFAATLYRGSPGGNPHDSFILFVMDLTSIGDFRNPSSDIEPQPIKIQGAWGQGGDVLIFENDEASYIPLKTSKGNAPKFNRLVSNPVFVGGKLYLAAYSSESNMSRLYTLDAEIFQKDGEGGNKKGLEEGVDYLDFQGEAFESAVFGSDGRLYVATEEGETYAFGEPPRMRTLYWRVKN